MATKILIYKSLFNSPTSGSKSKSNNSQLHIPGGSVLEQMEVED